LTEFHRYIAYQASPDENRIRALARGIAAFQTPVVWREMKIKNHNNPFILHSCLYLI